MFSIIELTHTLLFEDDFPSYAIEVIPPRLLQKFGAFSTNIVQKYLQTIHKKNAEVKSLLVEDAENRLIDHSMTSNCTSDMLSYYPGFQKKESEQCTSAVMQRSNEDDTGMDMLSNYFMSGI